MYEKLHVLLLFDLRSFSTCDCVKRNDADRSYQTWGTSRSVSGNLNAASVGPDRACRKSLAALGFGMVLPVFMNLNMFGADHARGHRHRRKDVSEAFNEISLLLSAHRDSGMSPPFRCGESLFARRRPIGGPLGGSPLGLPGARPDGPLGAALAEVMVAAARGDNGTPERLVQPAGRHAKSLPCLHGGPAKKQPGNYRIQVTTGPLCPPRTGTPGSCIRLDL